jgi:hypothetical protein
MCGKSIFTADYEVFVGFCNVVIAIWDLFSDFVFDDGETMVSPRGTRRRKMTRNHKNVVAVVESRPEINILDTTSPTLITQGSTTATTTTVTLPHYNNGSVLENATPNAVQRQSINHKDQQQFRGAHHYLGIARRLRKESASKTQKFLDLRRLSRQKQEPSLRPLANKEEAPKQQQRRVQIVLPTSSKPYHTRKSSRSNTSKTQVPTGNVSKKQTNKVKEVDEPSPPVEKPTGEAIVETKSKVDTVVSTSDSPDDNQQTDVSHHQSNDTAILAQHVAGEVTVERDQRSDQSESRMLHHNSNTTSNTQIDTIEEQRQEMTQVMLVDKEVTGRDSAPQKNQLSVVLRKEKDLDSPIMPRSHSMVQYRETVGERASLWQTQFATPPLSLSARSRTSVTTTKQLGYDQFAEKKDNEQRRVRFSARSYIG